MARRNDDPGLLLGMLDHAPTALILVDGDLTVQWANLHGAEVLGYELEEVIGRNAADFLDPDWHPMAFESILTAMGATGLRPPMLFKAIRKDGSRIVIEITANSQMQHPSLAGMVVMVRRWDERYLLDQALEAMAASRPLADTLRLLVQIAEAETLEGRASILHDRLGDRFGGAVVSDGLAPELVGPILGVPPAVADAWRPFVAVDEGTVHQVRSLPDLLRDHAERSGFGSLWIWPATQSSGGAAPATAIVWRRAEHTDTDETRRLAVERLARVAGLVLERTRSEERTLTTVLFTDIVDSTTAALRLGDTMWQRILEGHDAITRTEFARCGGHEVKHTGDGFLATFDAPARAVDCAKSIARGVLELGIEIRAGVHVGEIQQKGADVAGLGVHLAARIMAVAGPSEVLVSRTVRDVTMGSGLALDDRGEYELKGLPESVRLYRAC